MPYPNQFLDFCAQQIEQKLDRGALSSYGQTEYEFLAQEIHQASGIKLSYRTLSRLFSENPSKRPSPQKATRMALAKYLGHPDWETMETAFWKAQQKLPTKATRRQGKILTPLVFVSVALLLVGAIGFFHVYYQNQDFDLRNDLYIRFSTESGKAPVAVSLAYQKKTDSEEEVIFNTGSIYRIGNGFATAFPLEGDSGLINFSFTMPDYYQPSITTQKDTLLLAPVLVRSEGWRANVTYASLSDRTHYYRYLPNYEPFDSTLSLYSIKKDYLEEVLDPDFKVSYSEFRIVEQFDQIGDDLSISLDFKNERFFEGNTQRGAILIARCEHGIVKVKLSEKGGDLFNEFVLSEVHLDGARSDLGKLSVMKKGWNQICVSIKDGRARVMGNQKELINQTYEDKLGKLRALILVFNGAGQFRKPVVNGEKLN